MSTHLTDDDIEAAVRILTAWQDKLTWDRFLVTFGQITGKRITRQGIHKNHPGIREAFDEAVKRGRKNRQLQKVLTGKVPKGDADSSILAMQVARLTDELDALKCRNHDLMEKFLRWQHNAHAHGMTEEMLDRPIPVAGGGRNGASEPSP